MPLYHLVFFDAGGASIREGDIVAHADDEALARAERLDRANSIEVWHEGRLVGRVATSPPG